MSERSFTLRTTASFVVSLAIVLITDSMRLIQAVSSVSSPMFIGPDYSLSKQFLGQIITRHINNISGTFQLILMLIVDFGTSVGPSDPTTKCLAVYQFDSDSFYEFRHIHRICGLMPNCLS